MPPSRSNPPAADEIEVSIWGPGFGEAIAIHLGDEKWILVDSCLNPESRLPAALEYLHEIGVDPAEAVLHIVVTHWHDDHIRGIHALYSQCKAAKITISGALKHDEFQKLTSGYGLNEVEPDSGVDEVVQVFRLARERRKAANSGGSSFGGIGFGVANKTLLVHEFTVPAGNLSAKLSALSPSDATILKAQMAFAQRLDQSGNYRKRIAAPDHNETAVALWLEVGVQRLLLGADLENDGDPACGWTAVLNDSLTIGGRAGVFKVAHHGSANGHDDRVWSQLLAEKPLALLSPYNKGVSKLPTAEDIARITASTPNAFITAQPTKRPYHFARSAVRKMVEGATRSVTRVGWGHVRLRHTLVRPDEDWQVELFGNASALTNLSIS